MSNLITARRSLAESRLRIEGKAGDIVRIFGGLGSDSPVKGADTALAIAAADQRRPLAVLVDSPGGSIRDCQRVVDAIEARKGTTWTMAVSIASSAAAVIFAAGTQRWAHSFSVFNLHFTERTDRSEVDRMTAIELRKAADQVDAFDKWIVNFLHNKTRHPSALTRIIRRAA